MIGTFALMLAAIVSDDAKMFIAGGEWLPDQVPNRAYYDAADPAGKELRLTTNVAAAVASCYSGLCERGVVGTESGSVWWERFGPDKLGMETFKTNELWMIGCHGSDIWLNEPSNRVLSSRRLLSYEKIDRLRATLREFVDGYWNETHDYGDDKWNNMPWGSSKLHGLDIPTWDWDDRSPAVIVPDWTSVWPQFTSCTNDGIWKTSDRTWHSSLDSVFTFYDFGPFDDLYDLRYTVYTNALEDSCYRILSDRLGTNACQFASDSKRLSYYRLGAIETAIAAMDTTYHVEYYDPDGNDFLFERRSYFHQRGYENAQTPAVTIDWTRGTAEISGDPEWRAYDKWSTSTNDLYSYSHPAFVCSGDTPTGHQIVSGSSAIFVTWDILEDLGITHTEGGYSVTMAISQDKITFTAFHPISGAIIGSVTRQLPMTPWTVTMSAGVTRLISVGYTSTLATDSVERVNYPTPWAWSRGMVSNDVTALEYRVVCTNSLPGTDNSGWSFYWMGDAAERAETRSSHLGHYMTTNAYIQAWRTERLRHRSAVSNILSDYLGCSLVDRESLIPIPDAPCAAMRDAADKKLSGQLGVNRIVDIIYATMSPNGDSYSITYDGTDGYIHSLPDFRPGDSLLVGTLSFSAVDDWDIDISMKGRSPCYSWGNAIPACRIGWRFMSLRDE